MTRPKLSATIITLNEGKKIEATLRALGFADEVIVMDSGSSDDTCAIAQRLGAKVFTQSWLGYGKQKNLGFLDGTLGLIIAVNAAHSMFLKQAFLLRNEDTI